MAKGHYQAPWCMVSAMWCLLNSKIVKAHVFDGERVLSNMGVCLGLHRFDGHDTCVRVRTRFEAKEVRETCHVCHHIFALGHAKRDEVNEKLRHPCQHPCASVPRPNLEQCLSFLAVRCKVKGFCDQLGLRAATIVLHAN